MFCIFLLCYRCMKWIGQEEVNWSKKWIKRRSLLKLESSSGDLQRPRDVSKLQRGGTSILCSRWGVDEATRESDEFWLRFCVPDGSQLTSPAVSRARYNSEDFASCMMYLLGSRKLNLEITRASPAGSRTRWSATTWFQWDHDAVDRTKSFLFCF